MTKLWDRIIEDYKMSSVFKGNRLLDTTRKQRNV